jgi:protein-S-isoprenylcysteine O-methyltransferase Ste14
VKFLLFGAIAVNVVASLYLALIAPILVYGWNNTSFSAGWAIAVGAFLFAAIGGSIVAFIWRNARPARAVLVASIPAVVAVIAGLWSMLAAE